MQPTAGLHVFTGEAAAEEPVPVFRTPLPSFPGNDFSPGSQSCMEFCC
jgi:hypothetical protein